MKQAIGNTVSGKNEKYNMKGKHQKTEAHSENTSGPHDVMDHHIVAAEGRLTFSL